MKNYTLKCMLITFTIVFIKLISIFNTVKAAAFYEANTMDTLNRFIYDNVKAFGGLAILLGVSIVGYKLIFHGTNPEERSKSMTAVLYIAVGSFIIGSCMLIFSFIITMRNDLVKTSVNPPDIKVESENKDLKDVAANFLERALTLPVDLAVNSFIGGTTFSGITSKGGIQSFIGFKPLDELIFNNGKINGDDPFTADEWNNLTALYGIVAGLTAPFIMIMIFKVGYSFIIHSNSVTKRIILKEDMCRWIYSIFAIAAGPIFIKLIFMIFNMLTLILYNGIIEKSLNKFPFFELSFVDSIHTGSVLITAIVKVIFVYLDFKINIIFLGRKIVLVTMFAFTPIAAVLWGINKNVNAAAIWFGEMITNASMSFFYGFTFCVMITALKSTGISGWFYGMMWMFAVIKISEMLRNSLQGIFTKLSGIDEEQMGKQASGVVGGLIKGIAATAVGRAEVAGYFSAEKSNMNAIKEKSFNESNNIGNGGKQQLDFTKEQDGVSSSKGQDVGLENENSSSNSEKKYRSISDNNKSKNFEGASATSPYASLFEDNYNNEMNLTSAQGQIVRDISNFTGASFGRNSSLGAATNALLKINDMNLRSNAAGRAINKTIKTIIEDSEAGGQSITEEEAVQVLFGADSQEQANIKKNIFIKSISRGDFKGAEKIIARTNPYINPDSGFKWS